MIGNRTAKDAPIRFVWTRLAVSVPSRSRISSSIHLTAVTATEDGRRSVALAREAGDPAAEAHALGQLGLTVMNAGDLGGAVRLVRQAEQIPADIPGRRARLYSYILTEALTAAGDLAAAGRVCAASLAWSRDAGDLWDLVILLPQMAILDLRTGRTGDAAAHLREHSRSPCGPVPGLSWATLWEAAGTCAPRPGGAPRRSRRGRRPPRSCGRRDT